jgi:class 3 adenylate cyclase
MIGTAPAAPALTPATEPKPQDTAERREVTVMFTDLIGSTALSARMDPEDLREVISAYQKCVSETVERFGGFCLFDAVDERALCLFLLVVGRSIGLIGSHGHLLRKVRMNLLSVERAIEWHSRGRGFDFSTTSASTVRSSLPACPLASRTMKHACCSRASR